MVGVRSWNAIVVLITILENSCASTHWIVTENGRIQAQVDSAFHLRRPYDLLALLEQEHRVQTIDNLYQELVSRKTSIDSQWSSLQGATDLETRLYSEDGDCVRAGRPLPDVDLFEKHFGDLNKRIRLEKYLATEVVSENYPKEPDCINAVPLDFSMHTFEHLHALLDRVNLSADPQPGLLLSIPGVHSDVAEFGKQIASALLKNNTSWLHHNLAALYWRIQGDGFKAAECARRAIHYSPRHYRDLPLLTLGELLFQAHRPAEAAIVLHAAVDHAPNTPLSHLALGNVYAVLADYNRSVACYENALKLQPDLEEVALHKYSALCHLKLERGLLELHESLQGIVTELHEYHSKHKLWIKYQEDLMWQQAPLELRLLNNNQQLTTIEENRGQSCVQKVLDGQTVLSCDANNDNHLLAQSITLSLQMLLKSVESQAKLVGEHVTLVSPQIYQREKRRPKTTKVDPPSMPNIRQPQDEKGKAARTKAVFEQDGWPSKSECSAFNGKFPPSNGIPSMYLPPENRGFQVHLYLSQLIDLPVGTEHSLPWYPPVCTEQQKEQDVTFSHNQGFAPEIDLRPHLLKYGVEGHSVDAEIGQRILTAITKEVGPKWLLHTLGSLYWRIKGNPRNALACLQVALDSCPWQFRDIILLSQGAVLHRLGQTDEALIAITEALSIKSDEPISNFLMATLLNAKGNYSGAAFHLLQTLIKEPNYLNGLALNFLRHTSCKQKYGLHATSTPVAPNPEKEMCGAANVKSGDILSNLGETVLCSPDGEQCRAVQCFSTNQEPGVGNMVMLEPSSVQQIHSTNSEAECGSSSRLHSGNRHNLYTAQTDHSKQLHLRISLGEDTSSHNFPPVGDFIVSLSDEPAPDAWLNVYDKSGTYPLSPNQCKRLRKINWDEHMGQWLSSSAPATIRLQEHLPHMFQRKYEAIVEPHCDSSVPISSDSLDYLEGVRLRNRLQLSPEIALAPWLSVIIGADGSSTQELGILLALALQENATSWALATVAALYWRIVGQAEEAVNCIRQALQYAPSSSKKFPLTSLASILHRAGFYNDALAVATMALELSPTFEIAHFTIANIHAAMGDLDKAISHYRSSLTIQPEMEPARNRLQFILCLLLFEENGTKTNLL